MRESSDANVPVGSRQPKRSSSETRRGRFYVSAPFAGYFPAAEFPHYRDFVNIVGLTSKQDHRTRVVIFYRHADDDAERKSCGFVVKSYHYPAVPRIRTGFRISKAENEFKSLLYLKQLGVAAVEPVAYGAERTKLGFVRSCFIITRYLQAATNLEDWHFLNVDNEAAVQRAAYLRRLGAIFRQLHSVRFFLFTAKPRNILLHRGAEMSSELHLLDTPFARTLHWRPLARWAQSRDLGYCLGSFHPPITTPNLASFYEGYLPDVLGSKAESVQRRVSHAIRVQQNTTPLSHSVHALKLYLRQRLSDLLPPEAA